MVEIVCDQFIAVMLGIPKLSSDVLAGSACLQDTSGYTVMVESTSQIICAAAVSHTVLRRL